MSELEVPARITALRSTFDTIEAVLDPATLESEIARLSELAAEPNLWDDTDRAQSITSDLSHRRGELARIKDVFARLEDLDVLVDMAQEEDDAASAKEVVEEITQLEKILGQMEIQTLLDGEFDASPAIITIRAGAGGVDAADFAECSCACICAGQNHTVSLPPCWTPVMQKKPELKVRLFRWMALMPLERSAWRREPIGLCG